MNESGSNVFKQISSPANGQLDETSDHVRRDPPLSRELQVLVNEKIVPAAKAVRELDAMLVAGPKSAHFKELQALREKMMADLSSYAGKNDDLKWIVADRLRRK